MLARRNLRLGRGDRVAHHQHADVIPGELPAVLWAPGQVGVSAMPAFEPEAGLPRLEADSFGVGAPPDAERAPQLALVLAAELDGAVGRGRAAAAPGIRRQVVEVAGIGDTAHSV